MTPNPDKTSLMRFMRFRFEAIFLRMRRNSARDFAMHESSSNTTTPAPSQFGKTALAGFDEILQPIEEYPISKDKLKLLKLVVDILKLLSFILNGIKDKISGSNLNTARSYGTSNMKEFSCSAARIIAPFFLVE